LKQAGGFSWGAVSVVVACTLGNGVSSVPMINATYGVFLVPVSKALGWPRADFSMVLLIMAVVGVIGHPAAGRLADRVGVKPVILVGNVLLALSVAALYFTSSSRIAVYGLYVLVGIAATLSSVVLLSKPISVCFERTRGFFFAISGAFGINVSASIIPAVVALWMTQYGWRAAYLGIAAVIFVVGFPALLLLPRRLAPAATRSAAPSALEGMTLREAARTRSFWLLLGGIAGGAGSLTATVTHIIPILTDRHLSMQLATGVFGAMALCNASWQVVMGWLLDRTSSPKVAGFFLAISLLGLLLLGGATGSTTLLAGGILLGMGTGTEYALLPYAIPRYFGNRHFSAIYGAIYGVTILVSGVAPILMDVVFDATGQYRNALIAMAITISASALVFALLPIYQSGPVKMPEDGPEGGLADLRLRGAAPVL
jgi:MFS family permease